MTMPDLSPGVASRVVEISAVEFTEDVPKAGTVRFTLPCDLRHAASGTIIAAGSHTVTLVDGRASIRIFIDSPTLTSDTTRRGRDPWAIMVKKSWQSNSYPIRVPSGSGPVNLAAIPVFDWRTQ